MNKFIVVGTAIMLPLLSTVAQSRNKVELDTGLAQAVEARQYMIVTANPLASGAGAEILKRGGSAVDAMIAAQTVLGLVEPQSSGIGGGAFVVYYDALEDRLTTFDAREKAPSSAKKDRFVNVEGGFRGAWQSGLSVGVPGVPRLMEDMHALYGKKNMRSLVQPARKLARKGFELTERTSSQVAGLLGLNTGCSDEDRLYFRDPVAFAYFATIDGDDCAAKPAGTRIKNPDYAETLDILSLQGADAFYNGDVAADIAAAVQTDPNIPGDMTEEDLANYTVEERAPVCIEYKDHDVCGMGPPSSGALAVGQILGIMENFPVGQAEASDIGDLSEPLSDGTVHLFTQAGRLAFADRGQFVGDTDFITVPVEGMLNKDYLKSRAELIGSIDIGSQEAGDPPGVFDPTTPDLTAKNSGTSHISIVDKYGNALSMTTTVESSFGNGVMVRGFLLNNQLTDFSFNPGTEDAPVANRVQANKRPRSSMSPTIVLDSNGDVELVTGSPGGSRIIAYTAQSVMNHIDFGLDPQESINVPHYMNRNGSTDIEMPIPDVTLDYNAEALEATLVDERLHAVNIRDLTSGLSIIHVQKNRLVGGADKRRDGTVSGR